MYCKTLFTLNCHDSQGPNGVAQVILPAPIRIWERKRTWTDVVGRTICVRWKFVPTRSVIIWRTIPYIQSKFKFVFYLKINLKVLNYILYIFRSHCACDDMLYSCLKKTNTSAAQVMGSIYFNLAQVFSSEKKINKIQIFITYFFRPKIGALSTGDAKRIDVP